MTSEGDRKATVLPTLDFLHPTGQGPEWVLSSFLLSGVGVRWGGRREDAR